MVSETELLALAERVLAAEKPDNALDVLVEVALFERDGEYISARANAAGTKVIFSRPDGSENTHWALDWTENAAARDQAAQCLRSLANIRAHASLRKAPTA